MTKPKKEDTLAQVRRAQKAGLEAGAMQEIVSSVLSFCWVADFAALWSIVEAASGVPRIKIAPRLGVSNRTLTRWQAGHCIPLAPAFDSLVPLLVEFSGLSENIWREAWERSLVRLRNEQVRATVPRPEWAKEFTGAGLPLKFYLSRIRHEHNLTLSMAARKVGVPREVYEKWEEGIASPRAWQITRVWKSLAAPLGVTLYELVDARDEAAHHASVEARQRNRLEGRVKALPQADVDGEDILAMVRKQWGDS